MLKKSSPGDSGMYRILKTTDLEGKLSKSLNRITQWMRLVSSTKYNTGNTAEKRLDKSRLRTSEG